MGYIFCFLFGVIIVILLSTFHRLGKEHSENHAMRKQLGMENREATTASALQVRLDRHQEASSGNYIDVMLSGAIRVLDPEKELVITTRLFDVTNPLLKTAVKEVVYGTSQIEDFVRKHDYVNAMFEEEPIHQFKKEECISTIPLDQINTVKSGERTILVDVCAFQEIDYREHRLIGRQKAKFKYYQ